MRPLVARASGAALVLASVVGACTSASTTGDEGVAGGVDNAGGAPGAGTGGTGTAGSTTTGGHGATAPDGGVTSFPDGSALGGAGGHGGAAGGSSGGGATGGVSAVGTGGSAGPGAGGVGGAPVGPGGGGFTAGPGGGPPCTPQCTGKQCGPDGCNVGGLCGTCGATSTCNASGLCACVPQCAGKQCGADGCTGQCGPGCSSSQTCDVTGQCVATSLPTWSTQVAGASIHRAALDPSGSPLYVAGALGGSGWLAAIDPGSGSSLVSVNVGLPPSALRALKIGNAQVMVGGYETPAGPNGSEGSFQTFALGTLGPAGGLEPLYGGAMLDEVLDVVFEDSASPIIWMAGATNLAASGQTGGIWGIVQSSPASACGFPALPGVGAARSVLLLGGATYLLAVADGQGAVARFGTTADCTGVGQASAPFAIGSVSTDPRQMVAVGGTLYIAGNADDGAGAFGFLAAIDPASLSVTASYHDIVAVRRYESLATDGTSLCVGGSQGAIGYVGLWTTGFGSVWAAGGALPAGTDVVSGIACDGTSLFAAAENGAVAKCTMTGLCP